MSRSISEETHQKTEALQDEGRLCARDRCGKRADRAITQEVWRHSFEQGPSWTLDMVLCRKHADYTPVGHQGPNYRVLNISELDK